MMGKDLVYCLKYSPCLQLQLILPQEGLDMGKSYPSPTVINQQHPIGFFLPTNKSPIGPFWNGAILLETDG